MTLAHAHSVSSAPAPAAAAAPCGRAGSVPDAFIGWRADATRLPVISVVTPCLNAADYLEAALRSVLTQGYPNLEYVVMDGGSRDGSVDIIRRYAPSLSHWQSRPDGGQYDAIQRGFERTSGSIMLWLNADDLLLPGALWTIAEIFSTLPQVRWLHGRPAHVDAAGRWHFCDPLPRWSRRRLLAGRCGWIQQESVVWRRDLWDEAGGRLDPGAALAADLELWTRFFRCAELYSTTAGLGGFRHRPGQRSRAQRAAYEREAERILAAQRPNRADAAALRRLRRLERFWLRLPLLGNSWRLRDARCRLLALPPVIDYDHDAARFVLREVAPC